MNDVLARDRLAIEDAANKLIGDHVIHPDQWSYGFEVFYRLGYQQTASMRTILTRHLHAEIGKLKKQLSRECVQFVCEI